MKLKLSYGSIDSVLCDIVACLHDALGAKPKAEKDRHISQALGKVEAMYRLLEECEEEFESHDGQEDDDA